MTGQPAHEMLMAQRAGAGHDSREPYGSSGISVNDVELRRVIDVPIPGAALPRLVLGFTALADGTVRPCPASV